ncbi:phytanoyl-CoA dioxygenase family protein [Sporormia fimetaria CBS 119925]|uniref:Phytanoyl-CoA dioxygenase family protein n=1 Tax=Sporormia fimetaria CBS 119925 TaxID=1340428 RepID=A0A6A6V2R3_9PLEO|nr:phytanoyl-CoA dioxygenase family protein [Sporormia fimetaria CBS 119925]
MASSTTTIDLAPKQDSEQTGNPSPSTTISPSVPTNPYTTAHAHLLTHGFVILPATLFPSFSLPSLRAAATRLTHSARTGHWPYIRTLPKQFPPWPSDPSHGIWGVQHLLHPSNPDALLFARSYFDSELLRYACAMMGMTSSKNNEKDGREELVMELYNLLVRPDDKFALRWHRDDIAADATKEEEEARLCPPEGKPSAKHTQWNLALYDDASLIVVPGSHRRARTEVERNAHPYEDDMPGQMVVRLKAGEVVFYDNNILHRGVYDSSVERATLHGSVGSVGGGERARNVLQHGVGEWVGGIKYLEGEEEWMRVAEGMRERLVELGRVSGDVGFFSKEE